MMKIEPTLEWEDKWGCKHTVTYGRAKELLQEFYNEWPGGFEEIESCINHWRNIAISLEEEMNKGIE